MDVRRGGHVVWPAQQRRALDAHRAGGGCGVVDAEPQLREPEAGRIALAVGRRRAGCQLGVDDPASSTRAVCIEGAALLGGPDDAPTGAHIHAGRVDQNGPVEVTLPTPGTDGFLDGCVEADRTTVNAIEADRAAHYVNVHSSDYPAGAMRGQLRPDLLAALDGWQALAGSEPGGGALLGAGLGWFFVGAGDTLCTLLDGDRIGAVTQAHIHDAPTGQAGPIAFDLVTPQEGEPLDVLLECGNTARPGYGFADLLGDPNGFYVNLHTDAYPEGAIRGQLEPFPS